MAIFSELVLKLKAEYTASLEKTPTQD